MGLVSLLTNLEQFRFYTGKGYTGDGDVPGLDVGSITYSSKNPAGVPLTDLLSNSSRFIYYSSEGYPSDGSNPGMKSLKYGNDQLGGGNSGQPYIQVSIPDGFNDLQLSNNDFILRGGSLSSKNSVTDVLRLGKMFKDTKSPNGLLFIAKQNLLSRTAVKTQTSGIINGGVYTPLSTLAQVGLVSSGGHLNKQGLNPFSETGAYSNNSNLYGVKIKTTQPASENRLVEIFNTKQNVANENINIQSYSGGPGSILGVGKTNIRFTDQRTGINSSKNVKNGDNWFYGPNTWTPHSLFGNIFDTFNQIENNIFGNFIPLQSESNIINNVYQSATSYITPTQYVNNFQLIVESPLLVTQTPQPGAATNQQFVQNTFTYAQGNINAENKPILGSPAIQDFRKILRSNIESLSNKETLTNSTAIGATPISPDYNGPTSKAYESRVNIGGRNNLGPGNKQGKNLVSYTDGSGIGPIDKLNAEPVYESDKVKLNSDEYPVNDLVKFRIAVISNQDPNQKTFIHFRAFIDNFSDSYNANWNPVTYLGRGENFYTYSNFTRNISMGWTVAAQSKQELIPMYKKLNFLASSLTPDYTPKGYMAGNLVQLTVGGYLYETVGIINSITYDIPEESPWEIGINVEGGDDTSVKELPHIIRVTNFSFTPIQDFIPSVQPLGNQDGLSRYISLADGDGSNNTNYRDNISTLNGISSNNKTSKIENAKINRISLPKSNTAIANAAKADAAKTNTKTNAKINPNPKKSVPKKINKPTTKSETTFSRKGIVPFF